MQEINSAEKLSAPASIDVASGGGRATCFDADDLRRGLLGDMSRQDQADFERHVLSCRVCQRRLEEFYSRESLLHLPYDVSAASATHDVDTADYARSRPTPFGTDSGNLRMTAEFVGNDRFKVERRLGAGGMGIVYQAYDRQRRETVALKTLRSLGESAAMRLTQEFRGLADLRHPHLVSLYELYADGERRFFTMELLTGNDFRTYVRGPLPDETNADRVARLSPLLPQLLSGLKALHAAGKLHRDIKPSNVIVTRAGRLVLVDFGLVTEFQREDETASMIAGTAAYMSPEQAAGRPLTPASDWYSVGVMLFEALTGELPFAGRAREIMARKQLEEPLPLDYWANDLPANLQELCAALLRIDPAERPTEDEIAARCATEDGLPSPSPFLRDGLGTPSSRPAIVSPLEKAGGTPAPQLFVGRQRELDALHAAFEQVAAGGAHVVLLRGPSGVGKSALCAEFFRRLAGQHEAVLLTGRCYERELVPYKAADSFMDSLVRHVERQPPADVARWCPPELAAAVHILPVLRRLSAVKAMLAEGGSATGDLADLKRRAFAGLRELLRRMTARAPIVFFIDDLQWGDADSPALFAEWLRGPNAPRLLFVGAYRDEAADGGLWLKTWRDVERKSGFTWTSDDLPIGPLDAADAQQLAQTLSQQLGQLEDDSIADDVAERAMGHPLFLRELVEHALSDCGAGVPPAAVYGTPVTEQAGRLHHNLPSLSEMLARRFTALDGDAYRLLEAVAVAGYPIALERAYRAAGLSLDRRAPLYTLIDANLARTIADDHLGKLVTYHDSVRETLVARSSADTLRDAHRRLAQAAAAESPADDEALVLHYQGAGEAELAARHAAAAADRAAGNLAFDLAIRCYRLALESPTWEDDEGGVLRRNLADALAHAGHSAEAGREYRQLAHAAVGDDRWRFMRESGLQFFRTGIVDQALDVLAPLFQHLGLRPTRIGDRRLVGLICRRVWLAFTGYRVRPRPFRHTGTRILDQIDLCSGVGGPLTYHHILHGCALIAHGMHLALRSGDDARVALALAQEACMSALAGKRRRAARLIARIEVLAHRADDDYPRAGACCARGIGLIVEGDWRRALEQFDAMRSLELHLRRGKRFEVVQAEWYSQYALFYCGQLRQLAERVSDHLQDALERHDHLAAAFFRLNIANLAWLAADRSDDARRQIDESWREWVERPMIVSYFALTARLRLNVYLAEGAEAWRCFQNEWPWLLRSGLLRMPFFGVEAHHLRATIAVAAIHQGSADRIILRAARRSVAYLKRQPAAWPRALASLSQAGLLAAHGDATAAIDLYRRSHELLTRADMPLYSAAAQRRLGELIRDEQLVADADAALVDRGAANPRRFAALLAG